MPAPTPPRPLAKPDRRALLAAMGAGLVAGALPASGQPVQPPTLAATARAFHSRLVDGVATESTLFRLLPENAENPPSAESILFRLPGGGNGPIRDGALQIANRLDQPLSFLLRGLREGALAPGNTTPGQIAPGQIAPGQTGLIPLPARQAGSFLLTPVTPGHAREQIGRGLIHLAVVPEASPPPVDHDLPLLVSDWRLDEKGLLSGAFGEMRDVARMGRLGSRLVVNGKVAPATLTVRPGARIRLRIANGAMARTIPLHARGLVARVIAIDSTPCTPFDPLQRMVTLAPGGRCEIMIDLPAEPGQEARVEARFQNPAPLFIIRTEGARLDSKGPVPALPDPGLPPAIRLQNAARADLAISGGLPREADITPEALQRAFPDPRRVFRINGGKVGDIPGEKPGLPLLSVRVGREIVLALKNQTAWPQVIGVAGHSFRLLHPYDDGWEPYFLDTLFLAPGAVARIAFIAATKGDHAIRSTLPDHAEAGVATFFRVT